MTVSILTSSEYDESNAYYLGLVPKKEFHSALEQSKQETLNFFKNIPKEKQGYKYAEDKWTIKDILQHIIDVERIFAYRSLRFARKETVKLAGFEVDDYGQTAMGNSRSMEDLIKEYEINRTSTQLLFKSFSDEMLKEIGTASGIQISVRAMGFKLIGHDLHHCQIIRERYL